MRQKKIFLVLIGILVTVGLTSACGKRLYNLLDDPNIYTPTTFKSQALAKSIFIAKVEDNRPVVEQGARTMRVIGHNYMITYDKLWVEPVPTMVARYLAKEIKSSNIISQVTTFLENPGSSNNSDYIMEIKINHLYGKWEEREVNKWLPTFGAVPEPISAIAEIEIKIIPSKSKLKGNLIKTYNKEYISSISTYRANKLGHAYTAVGKVLNQLTEDFLKDLNNRLK